MSDSFGLSRPRGTSALPLASMNMGWLNSLIHSVDGVRTKSAGVPLEDSLLVSGPSFGERQGGLYLVKRSGWLGGVEARRIDSLSTSGIGMENGLFVRSLQHEDFMILAAYTESSVWTIASEKFGQIHDVRVLNGKLYIVSANTNEVALMTTAGEIEKVWTFEGGKDAWHLNCIDVWDGRVVACAFGRFKDAGGFRGARNTGIIFDLETQEDLWTGLTAPHTPRIDARGVRYVCDSGRRKLLTRKNGKDHAIAFENCFPRGLAFGERYVYVGLSCKRKKGPDVVSIPNAMIAVIDAETFAQVGEIELPMPEIYDIIVIPH